MCKKQTSVSHSSTESEIISLDAWLRLDGIAALDLWDLIVSVLGNTNQNHAEQEDLLTNKREVRSPPHTIYKRKQSQRAINDLNIVYFIPSNVQSSHQDALLYVFEDNEAVIKMIIKGRSPAMRHVSRTHRVALDLLFDRMNLDPEIQIKYIDTKNQLADILTKGNFTQHYPFQFYRLFWGDVEKNAKKIQVKKESQQSRSRWWIWSRDAAKGLLMCYLPGKTRHESQFPLSSRTEQHHRTGRLFVVAQHMNRIIVQNEHRR